MKTFQDFKTLGESYLGKNAVRELVAAHAALEKHESIPTPKRGADHDEVRTKLRTAYDKARAYHAHATR